MELCASPLNAHFQRYCSAFLDTDAGFGSLGDCFQFDPEEGSFEANPPFDPELISRLAGHLEARLALASDDTRQIRHAILIIFVPLCLELRETI